MKMTEICIERAANGFIIECEYKPKKRAMNSSIAYSNERKIEHIAANENDLIKIVKSLLAKLEQEDESKD